MDNRNSRGKGTSLTKFTKTGDPKHAGNWSAQNIHRQSLQYRDYYVKLLKSESGIEILIVGDHTPLARIMGETVATLAMRDPNFESYRQQGYFKGINNGRSYEAFRTLRKNNKYINSWQHNPHAFILREEIYTDGDFKYYFPEY